MTDYKELYLTLFRSTEKAIRTLVTAQKECEELYLSAPGSTSNIMTIDGKKSTPCANENGPD